MASQLQAEALLCSPPCETSIAPHRELCCGLSFAVEAVLSSRLHWHKLIYSTSIVHLRTQRLDRRPSFALPQTYTFR